LQLAGVAGVLGVKTPPPQIKIGIKFINYLNSHICQVQNVKNTKPLHIRMLKNQTLNEEAIW